MTNNLPKRIAHKTLIKHKHYSFNNYIDLKRIVESNQFTIIEYKKHANSAHVSELIKRLQIENEIQQNDSFLYINNNLKFVFLNSDISDDDKCCLLRHELGHIYDPDLKSSEIGHSNVKKEEFANEFSFYIKNPGAVFTFKLFLMRRWKLLLSILTLTACLLGLFVMINSLVIRPAKSVTDTSTSKISDNIYYVTSSGKKYHRKFCVAIKYRTNLTEYTLKEAVDAGYEPCLICNPNEE